MSSVQMFAESSFASVINSEMELIKNQMKSTSTGSSDIKKNSLKRPRCFISASTSSEEGAKRQRSLTPEEEMMSSKRTAPRMFAPKPKGIIVESDKVLQKPNTTVRCQEEKKNGNSEDLLKKIVEKRRLKEEKENAEKLKKVAETKSLFQQAKEQRIKMAQEAKVTGVWGVEQQPMKKRGRYNKY